VRTYMVPAFLQTWGDRAWTWFGTRPKTPGPALVGGLSPVRGAPAPPTDADER